MHNLIKVTILKHISFYVFWASLAHHLQLFCTNVCSLMMSLWGKNMYKLVCY